MPTRAPRACHCGRLQPCPAHARRPWGGRPSYRQRGYSAAWDRIAAQVKREHPVCQVCGDEPTIAADHIVPKHRGGEDTIENAQAIGRRCHALKTGRESAAARRR
jgi:5-methylcytosine-specific restriction protein A